MRFIKLVAALAAVLFIASACELGLPYNPPNLQVHHVVSAECAVDDLGNQEWCEMYPGQTLPNGAPIAYGFTEHGGVMNNTPKLMSFYRTDTEQWVQSPKTVVITGTRGGTFASSLPADYHPYQTERTVDSNGNWTMTWPFFPGLQNRSGCLNGEACDN